MNTLGEKTLMAGIQPLSIVRLEPVNKKLILPNGVFVPVGNRPDDATLQLIGHMTGGSQIPKRVIPPDQTTEGVHLGAMMDYGISPVTRLDVNSEHINNCHVLAAVGVATDGENPTEQRGLYAHINPAAHLLNSNRFPEVLAERIEQFRQSTHLYTRDVLIAGGAIDIQNRKRAAWTKDLCIRSINIIAEACKPLDVEPTVTLPTLESLDTSISLGTQKRELYIRPSGPARMAIPEHAFPSVFFASQAKDIIEKLYACLEWK